MNRVDKKLDDAPKRVPLKIVKETVDIVDEKNTP